MMKKIIYLILTFLPLIGNTQVVSAWPDTTICAGQMVTLSATVNGSGPGNSGSVSLSDDQYSGVVPIGFTFNYFGNNYNNCVISSNGYISFNIANANGYSAWSINSPIPGPGTPLNSIMAPWQDINPSLFTSPNGVISYKTVGTAPNRIFIVEFKDINMFSCTNICYGGQIHLYEGSNIIETHIANKQLCNTWNNGRAIHGIQNANGTIAVAVPGRNFPNQWFAVSDGRRFTPSGNTYALTTVPFSPIFISNNIPAIQWTTLAGQVIGTGNSIVVSPNTTTSYIARLPYSSCGTSFFQDTVNVVVGAMSVNTSSDTAICLGDTIQIWALGTTGQNITYQWSPNSNINNINVSNPLVSPLQTTSYTVTVSSNICVGTETINIVVNGLPSVTTINDTTICPGDSLFIFASGASNYTWSPSQNSSSFWSSPQNQTQFTVTGIDINGCIGYDSVVISLFQSPQVSIMPLNPQICYGDSIFISASGAVNYTWLSTGLNSDSIKVSPQQTQDYIVIGTDSNGCVDSAFLNLVVWQNPTANFQILPNEACQPSKIQFTDLSFGNSSIIFWNWTIETKGTFLQQNLELDFNNPGFYDVELSIIDANGCRDTFNLDSAVIIRPTPNADFISNRYKTNLNDPVFILTDESSSDVSYWYWSFNDNDFSLQKNPTWIASDVGFYQIELVVTNIWGCKDSTSKIFEVEDIFEIWIPNSFTPDINGINETFRIYGDGWKFTNFYVLIFNRWGQKIFESNNPQFQWNGQFENTKSPQGVYTYRIVFEQDKFPFYRDILGKINLIR